MRWSTRPKPEILWCFIEDERNNLLKQYEFGFSRTITVHRPLPGEAGVTMTADLLGVRGGELPCQNLPGLASCFTDGPFKGCSEQEVANEAVIWWDRLLTDIERQARARLYRSAAAPERE